MIKSKYSPMGVSALMNERYDRPESIMPCNAYTYSIHPLNYYCVGSIFKIDDETSTTFKIAVNRLDVDIYDTAGGRALDEGFNVMPDLPMEKEYKNDPEKLNKYERGYQATKDKYEKYLADNEKSFKPAFENIAKQLEMNTGILSQIAIVKRDPDDRYHDLFTDDSDI